MIFELRIYRFHPGQKKKFLAAFRRARRFMGKYGVTFVGAWENQDREDEFLWLRSFASMRARERALEKYYGSREWSKIDRVIRPPIKSREVRILRALPFREYSKNTLNRKSQKTAKDVLPVLVGE